MAATVLDLRSRARAPTSVDCFGPVTTSDSTPSGPLFKPAQAHQYSPGAHIMCRARAGPRDQRALSAALRPAVTIEQCLAELAARRCPSRTPLAPPPLSWLSRSRTRELKSRGAIGSSDDPFRSSMNENPVSASATIQ